MVDLNTLGYCDWFKSQEDSAKRLNHRIARVSSVHKESYTITVGGADIFAQLSGNLMYSRESACDLPTTGDWVYADIFDDGTHAIIYGVFPRKTLLRRKTPGKTVDFQLIAANIDVAFIIQSLNENLSIARLERYLAMINEGGIEPRILLSKSDLMPPAEVELLKDSVTADFPEIPVIVFSNINQANIESLAGSLKPGSTYCLLGSSGVGKTTLLNSILGCDTFETSDVSRKQSKGRHTTTSRQLVRLENGAMIIDTPGMRELGNMAVDDGIEDTFSEIVALSKNCRFGNCAHSGDKGCAVLAAVNAGELSERKYRNYLKIKKEAEYNEMSYREKRQKDKSFGQMVKTIKKNKHH